jgi:hypothetical protein
MVSDITKTALQARKAKGLPCYMRRPTGKSKLDEHNDRINGHLKKEFNLTAISKLIDNNRLTLAN